VTISGGHAGQSAAQPEPDPEQPTGAVVAPRQRVPDTPAATPAQAATAAPHATAPVLTSADTQNLAQAQATSVALAARQAASAAPAAAASGASPPASPGTVYAGTGDAGVGTGRRRRGLPRLAVGHHILSGSALSELVIRTPGTGLVLGRGQDKTLATVRMFRPEPTRVAMVGSTWLTSIVLMRALALGARIGIVSARLEAWSGFGKWATGRDDRVALLPADRPEVPPASAMQPGLLLWEPGPLGQSVPLALGPWQTQITLLSKLTAYGTQSAQEAAFAIVQRLSEAESQIAGSAWLMDPHRQYLTQVLNDDMVAIIDGPSDRYVWITPTATEQRYLSGLPIR